MRHHRNTFLTFFVVGGIGIRALTAHAEESPLRASPESDASQLRSVPHNTAPSVVAGSPSPQAKATPGIPRPQASRARIDATSDVTPGPPVEPGKSSVKSAPSPAARLNGAARAPAVTRFTSINDAIINAIRTMPEGGGYKTSGEAFAKLKRSVTIDPTGHLSLQAQLAKPSFCSGATFLVFLAVIDQLDRTGIVPLSPEARTALMVRDQPDGKGVWGRWNANGPGTARLFFESGLGRNFTSFDEARPGDFLKIWWSDTIGSTERGHSVIYLGASAGDGNVPSITFWSSNMPGGFGIKVVAKAKIKRALFSRLENVQAINRIVTLPPSDAYLAAMLKRPSSESEMYKVVGIQGSHSSLPHVNDGVEIPTARAVPKTGPATVSIGDLPKTITTDTSPDLSGREGVSTVPSTASASDSQASGKKPSTAKNAPLATPSPVATPPRKKGFFQRLFGK